MTTDATSGRPARNAGALQQLGAVVATDLPRLIRERRTIWLAVIQLAPVLAAGLFIQWFSLDSLHVYTGVLEWAYFPFLIPLVALFYGGPMLVDEIEQETLTYLTLRPVPKWALYAGKWAAATLVASAVAVGPVLLLFGVTSLLGAGGGPEVSSALNAALASLLATTAYVAVFAAVGVLFARSVIGSLIWFLLFDVVMGQIPVFKLATVRFHVFNVGQFEQPSGAETLGRLLNAGDITVAWGTSVAVAAAATLVMVAVGALIFSRRQYEL